MKHFDYIIAGAGASGLSLLMHMMQSGQFDDKEILVIDKAPKSENDRTWCFWEKETGIFEEIVYHRWQNLNFHSDYFSSILNFAPYTYKMIRGIDFYSHVVAASSERANITFKFGNIEKLGNDDKNAFVWVNGEKYTAGYVFNSVLLSKPQVPKNKYHLLQHFKGWMIETEEPCFDRNEATLMDFRVTQKKGTTFVYVLPVSDNKALIEYTLFSKELLEQHAYDEALGHYVELLLGGVSYQVTELEFGVIPMTNVEFGASNRRIINIGTAGGQTKASSGYTFQFIQKQSKEIVRALCRGRSPLIYSSLFSKRFKLYDSTLLNILHHNKLGGDRIFSDLFSKNPTDRVLRFLDNESSLADEILIMGSLPSRIFMKAALQEIIQ